MVHGYTKRLIKIVNDPELQGLGVELGRLCILHGYSATEVAEVLEVTRATVYGWFTGKYQPTKRMVPKMTDLVERLRQKPIAVPNDEIE